MKASRTTQAVALRRSALLCASMVAYAAPLHAQSIRAGVDVSAEAEASSNPYLDRQESGWTGAGTLDVRPWLIRETGTDRIELAGFARGRAFTSTYDFEDNVGASLGVSHRANPRRSYFGSASITSSSARSNANLFDRGFNSQPLAPPANPATPDQAPGSAPTLDPIIVPVPDDITLFGLQSRSTTLAVNAGLNQQIDSLSAIGASVAYNRLWIANDNLSGYDSITGSVNYSRTISPRTKGGLSLTAQQSRYQSAFPKMTTLGAYLNAEHQLSTIWSLNWSAGVSSAHAPALGPIPEIDSTSLAGSLSLCGAKARSNLCLSGARSQQPSTLGRPRISETVGVTYGRRLSARDSFDLQASYARNTAVSDDDTAFERFEIASIGANVVRVLNPRLEGYLFGRASRNDGGYLSDEPSISLGLGVRARFGDRR